MDSHRATRRSAVVGIVIALPIALLALGGAFLLAVFVTGATDPAAWGTAPAIAFAVAVLAGFFASLAVALLGCRLLSGAARRPGPSPDAVVLAFFTAIGAGAISLWAFGVGIGFDPRPAWLDPVAAIAAVAALLGALATTGMISAQLRWGSRGRG